jgi:beta-lactam-binding protein with PASTA domain
MVERKLKKMYIIIPIIVLIISIGTLIFFTYHQPKEIKMLNLESYSVKKIEDYAKDNDINLDIEYLDDENIPRGKLISQSIKMDSIINKGDYLKVVISKGHLIKIFM